MRFFRLAAVALLAAAPFFVSAPAQAQSTPDRAAVEGIVKDYLMQHPEVIEEALTQLQAKRDAQAALQQKSAVVANQDAILNAPQNVILGNPKGDVTLVEFFDYNCGYCKRGLADMLKLLDTDKNLRVELKDFPVLGPGSIEAAEVAVGVKQQLSGDKYLDFHKTLLATRGPVGKDQALQVARDEGVDMTKLAADMQAPSVRTKLGQTLKLGDTLGVSGTPTYVVGGELVVGAVGYDALKDKIDSVRKCGQTTCG